MSASTAIVGAATPPTGTTLAAYSTLSRSRAATWTVAPTSRARACAAGTTVVLCPCDCSIVRASPTSRQPSRYRPHAIRSRSPLSASSRRSSYALDFATPTSAATSVGPQYGRSTVKRSRTSPARPTPRILLPYPASRTATDDRRHPRQRQACERAGPARLGRAGIAQFGCAERCLARSRRSPIVRYPILIPAVDMMRSGRRGRAEPITMTFPVEVP